MSRTALKSAMMAALVGTLVGGVALAGLDEVKRPAHAAPKGMVLAVHRVGAGDPARTAEFVRQCLTHGTTHAGVGHVFVSDAATFATLSGGEAGGEGTTVLVDSGGGVMARLNLSGDGSGCEAMYRELAAKDKAPALDHYNLPKGKTLALQGYDPVAYFVEGRARKGVATITSSYQGVAYQFSSEENRAKFNDAPRKYLPTYGGWCASAMGDGGRKVEIDPTNFKVKDGRLFLFYKSIFADALKDWNKKEKEWEPSADGHWKKISGEDAVVE